MWAMMDYLIDFAAYSPRDIYKKGIGLIHLERGQWAFSEREIAEFFSVDRQQIRTRLKTLEMLEFLTQEKTHKITKVFIINYDHYQSNDEQANPPINPDLTQTKPRPNPVEDFTIYTKKVKKVKKVKERESVALPDWIDQETWAAFKEFRIRIKAPLTNRATKNIITELEKLKSSGNDPNAVIDQSITRGWRGVFELRKDGFKPKDTTGSETPPDRANKILQKMQERERMLRGEN